MPHSGHDIDKEEGKRKEDLQPQCSSVVKKKKKRRKKSEAEDSTLSRGLPLTPIDFTVF